MKYKRFAAGMLGFLMIWSPFIPSPGIVQAAQAQQKLSETGQDAGFVEDMDDPEYYKRLWQVAQRAKEQGTEPFVISASTTAKKTVSPFTGKTYTHDAKFNSSEVVLGIDVSRYQKDIDWAKVKAAGVTYAFIRCGYTSTGTNFSMKEDNYFKKNIDGAYAQGIKIGIYYFSNSKTTAEAKKEAEQTLALIEPYKSRITLPVVYDFEAFNSSYRGYGLSKSQITNNALAYFDVISDAGYTPMYYGSTNYIPQYFDANKVSGYQCWLAQYSTKATYTGNYTYWQYSSSGIVDGITTGYVDCNFWYSDWDPSGTGGATDPSGTNTTDPAGTNTTDPSGTNTTGPSGTGSTTDPSGTNTTDPSGTGSTTDPSGTNTTDPSGTGSTTNPSGTNTTDPSGSGGTTGANTTDPTGTNTTDPSSANTTDPKSEPTPDPEPDNLPEQVEGLEMTANAQDSISIRWEKADYADGYKIYRSSAYGGEYKLIHTVNHASTCTYKDSVEESQGLQYYYKVAAFHTEDGKDYEGQASDILTAHTKRKYNFGLTTNTNLNLRKQAGTEYAVLAAVPKGTEFIYYKYTKSKSGALWYKVTYKKNGKSYTGYLSGSYVTLHTYGKTTKKVNARAGAGLTYKIERQVPKSTKLAVKETTKDKAGTKWTQVSYTLDGKNYQSYIPNKYIKQI